MIDEFARLARERVGERELSDAQAYLAGSFPLTIETPDAPLQPHTHLVIETEAPAFNVRFRDPRRFGGIWWLGTAIAHDAALCTPHTTRSIGPGASAANAHERPVASPPPPSSVVSRAV